MADRMDLEARLRALRESKRVPSKPPAPQSAPSSTLPAVDSFSWPEAPSSSVKQIVPVRQPVPVSAEGYDQPARRYSSVFSAQPPVTIMSRCSPAESRAPTSFAASVASSKLTTAKEDMVQPTTAQLLGPDYEKAVQMAQHAIDSERRQMPRTAIDAYIQAGQMLIEIGRRQAAPHLQDIVKSKALALLQRAERLSEWINEVLANDSSQHALAAAYRQSQQNCNKSLTEKQELVLKMQQDNRNMKKKLNQLALLTKVRGRMMKVVRARRARKAAEARETEAQTQAIQDILSSRGVNDVTGEISGYQFEDEESNDVSGFSSDENEESRKIHLHAQSRHTLTRDASSGEVQNVGLINELHERIGIPRIDSFRKFEPLTNDPNTDKRQELLQSDGSGQARSRQAASCSARDGTALATCCTAFEEAFDQIGATESARVCKGAE